MKEKIKKICLIILFSTTIFCLVVSTLIVVKDRLNSKEYSLNKNEKYLISEYEKIITDINKNNDNLFLSSYLFTMEIKDKYIESLNTSFINEENSKQYFFIVKNNKNRLIIDVNEDITKKVSCTVPIKSYFEACYLGYEKMDSADCFIETDIILINNIHASDNNFYYENSKIVPIIDFIEGKFIELKFTDSNDNSFNVYLKYEEK